MLEPRDVDRGAGVDKILDEIASQTVRAVRVLANVEDAAIADVALATMAANRVDRDSKLAHTRRLDCPPDRSRSPIARLFRSRRPATVPRLVVAVVVDTVERHPLRTLAHVGEESGK
jgi:hypothetical protein